MARSKNSSLGIRRYNKVLTETRKALKKEGKDLTYRQAQAYVSRYVYPALKKVPNYKLHKTVINREAKTVIKHVPPEELDLTKHLSPGEKLSEILHSAVTFREFWEMEDIIRTALPQNINVLISGGAAGSVGPFVAKDFNRVIGQWHKVLAKIRNAASTRSKKQGESGRYTWTGVIRPMPGRPDNGNVKNYLIDFLLSDADGDVLSHEGEVPTDVIPFPIAEETLAQGTTRRKKLDKFKQRIKKHKKKHKAKPKAKETKVTTTRKLTPKQLLNITENRVKELELLRQDFKDGIYTKSEYKKERQKIINKYPV